MRPENTVTVRELMQYLGQQDPEAVVVVLTGDKSASPLHQAEVGHLPPGYEGNPMHVNTVTLIPSSLKQADGNKWITRLAV